MANPTPHAERVREVWNRRLRASERELVCEVARVTAERAHDTWEDLPPDEAQRLLHALRDLQQLGCEAEYALAYRGTGQHMKRKRGNSNGE